MLEERAQPLPQLEPMVEHDLAAVPLTGQATSFVTDGEHVAFLAMSWAMQGQTCWNSSSRMVWVCTHSPASLQNLP